MKKYIIWQNYNIDLRDEDNEDYLKQCYPEVTNEAEKYRIIEELNSFYLEDERARLDILLDDDIIIIADIGLWEGRRRGNKELHSNNIADCLQFEKNCEYAEWYVDQYGNFKSTQSHHDGTHYLLYRAWKKDVTNEQKENMLNGLYNGAISQRTLRRYTEGIGKYIAEVYGWRVKNERTNCGTSLD